MSSAQQPERGSDAAPAELQVLDRELTVRAQQLGDWSEQHRIITSVINNIWKQNDWHTEADRFARETAMRVERIPPWQFKDRMNLLIDATRARYRLDENQVRRFQQQLYQEMWGMTLKYGPTLMHNAREMLDTRLQGEPFTAEQVARWAEAFDPLMGDFEKDVKRMSADFGGTLSDAQRKIFERDLESLNKRMTYFVERSEAWKRGKWRAEDWGLQDDPIHYPQVKLRRAQEAMKRALERRVVADDESTWDRYVRNFITSYQLDEAQQKVCTSILDDVVVRARRYRTTHQDAISRLTRVEQADHALLEPLGTMFAELKSRLNAIPTERQRKQALENAPHP